jgi:hypothetical protein
MEGTEVTIFRLTSTGLNLFSNPSIRQGTFGVAEYRAFTIGADGHFVGFEPIVCDDDASAIERATRLLNDHDIEIWSRGRMVVRLHHKPPQE